MAYRSPSTASGSRTLARRILSSSSLGAPSAPLSPGPPWPLAPWAPLGDEELGDGDEQPFLVQLPGVRGEGAPPDVRQVADVAEEGHQAPAPEDGRHHRHVVEVAGGLPGVVGDQDVAGGQRLLGVDVQEVADAAGHGVDVPRGPRHRLGDEVAPGVEGAGGDVPRLGHGGGEGAADQGGGLLVDHRQEPAPEHLQGQRVDHLSRLRLPWGRVITRFHCASIRQAARGTTTAVDSSSSTTAGPRTWPPAPGGSGRTPGWGCSPPLPGSRPGALP